MRSTLLFKRKRKLMIIMAILITPLMMEFYTPAALANINSCSASVIPQQITPGSTNTFSFHLNNPDPSTIRWIRIVRPSANYNLQSAGSTGWTNQVNEEDVVFSGGSLSSGNSLSLSVTAQVINSETGKEFWYVYVSDDANGSNTLGCDGDLSVTNTTPVPPQISNIQLSELTSTTATITWTTDGPSNSIIKYGLDQNYGSTLSSPTHTTSHSLKLTRLTANTAYHYQVSSVNENGTATSADSTFLTAVEETPVIKLVTGSPIEIKVTDPGDKTPPVISLSTQLAKVVPAIPLMKGAASDDVAVMRVEYSTDGGKNWLPVDSAPGLGSKTTAFSFTPQNLDDGNYTMVVRAIDGGGNITKTAPASIVVDRLPPIVGGQVVALGPQMLEPNDQGIVNSMVGVDQKITVSAVGGATHIYLEPQKTDGHSKVACFSLTQSPDSGLWSGVLSFTTAGTYDLVAKAIDGAGNQTLRTLSTVQVMPAGKIIKSHTNEVVDKPKLTVYYLEPSSNNWTIWDGAAYAQQNPQQIHKNGTFRLFLPPGKYYLKATASGFHTLISNSFKLNQPTPITTDLSMKPSHHLDIGSLRIIWPNFSVARVNLQPKIQQLPKNLRQNSLIGKTSPDFALIDTTGHSVNVADLLGRPTVLSFLSTWSPSSSDQLGALSELQKNTDINTEPIALQENANRLRAYNLVAGYHLTWLADPDSIMTNRFGVSSLPTHYFIDRKGIVKRVVSGVLSQAELLNNLSVL